MKKLKYIITGIIIGVILSGIAVASGVVDVYFADVKYFFNGEEKQLPEGYETLEYKDRMYVPVRFVSETLGKDVYWNDGEVWINDATNYDTAIVSKTASNGEYDFYFSDDYELIAENKFSGEKTVIDHSNDNSYITANENYVFYNKKDKTNDSKLYCYNLTTKEETFIEYSSTYIANNNFLYYETMDNIVTDDDIIKLYYIMKYDPSTGEKTVLLEDEGYIGGKKDGWAIFAGNIYLMGINGDYLYYSQLHADEEAYEIIYRININDGTKEELLTTEDNYLNNAMFIEHIDENDNFYFPILYGLTKETYVKKTYMIDCTNGEIIYLPEKDEVKRYNY